MKLNLKLIFVPAVFFEIPNLTQPSLTYSSFTSVTMEWTDKHFRHFLFLCLALPLWGGGEGVPPLKLPGLGLYPSIREPRRRVVVVFAPRMCEMLRDFTRFHENARFFDSFTWSKPLRKYVNLYENRKNDTNKKCCKCDFMYTVEFLP